MTLSKVGGWGHRLQCIVIVRSFLRLLKLHKLVVGKLNLSRRGLTRCHGVLDHGFNLRWNIPLSKFVGVFLKVRCSASRDSIPALSVESLLFSSTQLCHIYTKESHMVTILSQQ